MATVRLWENNAGELRLQVDDRKWWIDATHYEPGFFTDDAKVLLHIVEMGAWAFDAYNAVAGLDISGWPHAQHETFVGRFDTMDAAWAALADAGFGIVYDVDMLREDNLAPVVQALESQGWLEVIADLVPPNPTSYSWACVAWCENNRSNFAYSSMGHAAKRYIGELT